MEGVLLASLVCNGFLIGVVLIMFKGASTMDREMKMLKAFSSALIDFTEEQTGKTTREVQHLFTIFMDKRKKKGD
jgi:hypothetical protein